MVITQISKHDQYVLLCMVELVQRSVLYRLASYHSNSNNGDSL